MVIVYRLQGVEFEWDDQKAQLNITNQASHLSKLRRSSLIHSINLAMPRQPL